jgi:ATP/maltotriose-dependent transcriptional regulator MalT
MIATETTLAQVLEELLESTRTMQRALLKADAEAVSAAVDHQVETIQQLESYAPSAWEELRQHPKLRDIVRQIVMLNEHNAELCHHGLRSLQALFSRLRQAQGYGPDGFAPAPVAVNTRFNTSI